MRSNYGWRGKHRLRGLLGGFSPQLLFASSEPGAWYDPSDLSTLYQDAAGTVPVTAAGQTVGLVLDKSKGLVLGPELVTNGDFSGGSTGWTLGSGWSVSGGVASFNPTGQSANIDLYSALSSAKNSAVTYDVTTNGAFSVILPVTAGDYVLVTGTVSNRTAGTIRVVLGSGRIYIRALYATGFNGSVDNISVRELPGNHATQATAASRPLLQQDATGRYYLLFDGTDDFLVTPTITPGTDKVQVFAGMRKLSDAVAGIVVETSPSATANNGGLYIAAPNSNAPTYGFASRGTSLGSAVSAGFSSPTTNVLTGIGDIAADVSILRVNGAQVASAATDQGTSNYLAYPMYIGRRGGTSLPLNGRLYGLIARFGANLSDAQIAQAESWLNGKTGAY